MQRVLNAFAVLLWAWLAINLYDSGLRDRGWAVPSSKEWRASEGRLIAPEDGTEDGIIRLVQSDGQVRRFTCEPYLAPKGVLTPSSRTCVYALAPRWSELSGAQAVVTYFEVGRLSIYGPPQQQVLTSLTVGETILIGPEARLAELTRAAEIEDFKRRSRSAYAQIVAALGLAAIVFWVWRLSRERIKRAVAG